MSRLREHRPGRTPQLLALLIVALFAGHAFASDPVVSNSSPCFRCGRSLNNYLASPQMPEGRLCASCRPQPSPQVIGGGALGSVQQLVPTSPAPNNLPVPPSPAPPTETPSMPVIPGTPPETSPAAPAPDQGPTPQPGAAPALEQPPARTTGPTQMPTIPSPTPPTSDTAINAPAVPTAPPAGGAGEGTPSPAATAMAEAVTAGAGDSGSLPTGLGEGMGGASGALVMFGDQGPRLGIPQPPNTPQIPGRPPTPGGGAGLDKHGTMLPWVRGFKFCENQSPIPQDRVFFNFNYYSNVNYAINGRFHSPIDNIQASRYLGGFEKTFLNGRMSFGIASEYNAVSINSPVAGLGGSSSSMGDMDVFFKGILLQRWADNQGPANASSFTQFFSGGRNGYLVSSGLAINLPTGPSTFAGVPYSRALRNTNMQPFVGYYARKGRFYFQGFECLAVPLDARDVLELYSDVGIGYFIYRNPSPKAWISAIAPTFEAHLNLPLTHNDPFNLNDPTGTATVLDLTYGTNILLGQRTLFSTAIVTPVTGPRPCNVEVMAILNFYFGGRRNRGAGVVPPVL